MTSNVPRILSLDVQHPMRLVLRFDAAPDVQQSVNLAGWIKRGGVDFARLADPRVFARATIGGYGGNITWDEDEGDLAIDSVHLEALATEQNPFTGADAVAWQRTLGLSDTEVADVLGLRPAEWQALTRSETALPTPIARLCRAVARDPFIAEAHLTSGRRDSAA